MAFPRAHADPDSQWPSAWASHHHPRRPPRDWVDLLTVIVAGTPRLPGASCARHDPELWEGDDPLFSSLAAAICRHCPVQRECLAWASSQPTGLLRGVIGGELFGAAP
jgi:Transcription factor WhiB